MTGAESTSPPIRQSASSPSLTTEQFQKVPPDIYSMSGTLPELLEIPIGDRSASDSLSTRSTQVNFNSGSESSAYKLHQEPYPIRPSRARPTSFPEQLPSLRYQQDAVVSRTPNYSEPHYNNYRAAYKSNNIPSRKMWRQLSSSSTARPVGLPNSMSQQSLSSRGCPCQCQCDSTRKQPCGEGPFLDEESAMTPEGLSWRRLHMSRAKLKATATTSELLSGFAMVAMVELQINEPTNVPEWLFVMFSVCTTVLVAVHIFALMISTYLLPNIDAVSKLQVHELVSQSPHERMRGFIELAWAFSTVLGLFLFLVEVAILCWVKFWDYSFTAAWAATIVVIPVLIVFVVFAVHFYHNLVVYKCESTVLDLKQLENMKKQLDTADCSPV